ncbi:hypothetical protein KEM60_03262 [Austwickia sp. TVS 96-490-7B]|nr:hypothetical protein [Austwickia sp. TVS 96-490-7B]
MGGQHTTVGTTRRVAVLDRGVAAQRILTALTSLNATDPSQRWVTVLVTNDPPDTEPWYARDADDILHLSHSAASPQTPTATASIATALRAADIDHAWIAPSPSVDPAALATALRDVGIGTLGADIPSWRQWHTPPNPLTDEHRPGRTVELLVLRDTTGQCHVLGPAEISHDGRHRPILVALPPHGLTATDIATIQDAARHCAHHGNLVGALTVHFRQDLTGWTITATEPAGHSRNAFWDHVTGHDLIALAASITTGGDLPATLEITTGHTLQARLLTDACDADHHLTSSTVAMVAPPHGVGVHTDLILREGDHVNPHLDPDIATVTAHGSDPTQTRHRVRAALEQLTVVLTTCTTNRTDLIQRLDSTAPEAAHDQQHTTSETDPLAVVIAAVEAYEQDLTEARLAFRASAARGRPHPFTQQGVDLTLTYQDRHHQVHVSRVAAATYQVRGRRTTTVDVHRKNPYQRRITLNGQRHRAVLSPLPDRLHLEIDGTAHDVIRLDEIAVRAPAPALICAITATPGQYVDKGSPIAVVESMKMTTTITAPLAGTILSVPVLPHEQVAPGTPLVRIRATPTITPPAADSPDPTTPSADGPPRDLFTRMRDHLLGYDQDRLGPATWEDDYRQLTTADPTSNELHTAEDALLDLFADLGSLYRPRTETRTSDPDDTTAFSNTQEYFLTYLIWLDADRAGLPLRYRARLERALNRYGIHTTSDPAALDEATFWLHRSFSRVPAMVPLVIHILQRRLDTARTHPEHITQVFKGRLERLIRATRGRQPAVTDLARDILFHLYDEPLLTRTPHEPPTHRPADHLDLWRLENFTLTPLPAPDDIHLFDAIAHDNPQDRRLFAIAEIHHLTPHT